MRSAKADPDPLHIGVYKHQSNTFSHGYKPHGGSLHSLHKQTGLHPLTTPTPNIQTQRLPRLAQADPDPLHIRVYKHQSNTFSHGYEPHGGSLHSLHKQRGLHPLTTPTPNIQTQQLPRSAQADPDPFPIGEYKHQSNTFSHGYKPHGGGLHSLHKQRGLHPCITSTLTLRPSCC
jgi:hypothetical protein